MRSTSGWIVAFAALAMAGCQQPGSSSGTPAPTGGARSAPAGQDAAPATSGATAGKEVILPNGLRIQDLMVGDGAIAESGHAVALHYTGWLTDGTRFDSSLDRHQPLQFRIGAQPREVIRGWDEGVRGMRVGGKRKLTIPPELGYGERGYRGLIPPNATLVFELELLNIH